ncbi:hypothetical protein QUA43_12140 [Microcoleus sp. N9_B4]|uniref:hypothetical protein n=1 Tax=Microcoleus sp. N9_B4 TaxID=3055386 RepID=UPI002FD63A48
MSNNYNYVGWDDFIPQTPQLPIAHSSFTHFTISVQPNRLSIERQNCKSALFL